MILVRFNRVFAKKAEHMQTQPRGAAQQYQHNHLNWKKKLRKTDKPIFGGQYLSVKMS